jgi:hypothetical protein
MSAIAIRAALEQQLASLAPEVVTIWDNEDPESAPEAPYQRASVLLAEPANTESGRAYQERGFLQVTLVYPPGLGWGAAMARAEAIRAHFPRGLALPAGPLSATVERTPEIAPGMTEVDGYVLPVRVRFYAHVPA